LIARKRRTRSGATSAFGVSALEFSEEAGVHFLVEDEPSPANAGKPPAPYAELYILEDFLNLEECEALVALIKSNLRPSTITNSDEPDKEFRTNSTCDLGLLDNPLVDKIDRRICRTMCIESSDCEVLQGQYYRVGEQFKAHTDYFEGDDLVTYGGKSGQRTYTFIVYLNAVKAGGETEFPDLHEVFSPRAGMALIWNNLKEDGSPNPHTLHLGRPVQAGYKAIITRWFRARETRRRFANILGRSDDRANKARRRGPRRRKSRRATSAYVRGRARSGK